MLQSTLRESLKEHILKEKFQIEQDCEERKTAEYRFQAILRLELYAVTHQFQNIQEENQEAPEEVVTEVHVLNIKIIF